MVLLISISSVRGELDPTCLDLLASVEAPHRVLSAAACRIGVLGRPIGPARIAPPERHLRRARLGYAIRQVRLHLPIRLPRVIRESNAHRPGDVFQRRVAPGERLAPEILRLLAAPLNLPVLYHRFPVLPAV